MLTQFGVYDEKLSERDVIFSSNIGHCYPAMIESLRRCNLIFVLYSDNIEFCFGDGFFHNLRPSSDPIRNAKILIPLTPCMAVVALVHNNCKSPGIRTLRLNNNELREINFVTQLYSIDCIFYREMRPEIDRAYFNGSFMSLKDQRWRLLEKMAEPFSDKTGY